MNIDFKRLRLGFAALTIAGLTMVAGPAFAGPVRTFSVSQGIQPSNVGTVTLTRSITRPWTCSLTWPTPPCRYRNMGLSTLADRIRRLRSP